MLMIYSMWFHVKDMMRFKQDLLRCRINSDDCVELSTSCYVVRMMN